MVVAKRDANLLKMRNMRFHLLRAPLNFRRTKEMNAPRATQILHALDT